MESARKAKNVRGSSKSSEVGKNKRVAPRRNQARGDLMQQLADLLKRHVGTRVGSTASVSKATADKRWKDLFAGFRLLRKLGMKLEKPESFDGRHMQALVTAWVEAGLSASTITNRISSFRIFSQWIGKKGMVELAARYVSNPSLVRRTSVATEDKSWTAKGIDAAALIGQVRLHSVRVATALELQLGLGLRMRESLLTKPHLADMGNVMDVYRGVKNGRRRMVRIDTEAARLALDRAKAVVSAMDESVAGPVTDGTWTQVRNRYYGVMRKVGITRKDLGVVSHMLRHENANDLFARLAGYASPVRGGPVPADPVMESYARAELAEHLGHSRPRITTHYVGRAKRPAEAKAKGKENKVGNDEAVEK